MPRILLVKTSSMGDVVHNLPILADINAHVAEASFHWVVEEAFAEIPLMHPLVSSVIPVATRRWRKRLFLPRIWAEIHDCRQQIRQTPYDYIIDSQGLIKSAILTRWAQGPVYGMDRTSARESFAARFYQHRFHIATGRHAVARNRELAARVFGYDLPGATPDYGINIECHLDTDLKLPDRFVVCLHGTSRESKLWPEQYWQDLAARLDGYGIQVVLPWGSTDEQQRANRLQSQISGALVLPRVGLKSLACVFRQAQAVVGVDTGLVHLATALGCPTVALFLDSSPRLTGVLGQVSAKAINLGERGRAPQAIEVVGALQSMEVIT